MPKGTKQLSKRAKSLGEERKLKKNWVRGKTRRGAKKGGISLKSQKQWGKEDGNRIKEKEKSI